MNCIGCIGMCLAKLCFVWTPEHCKGGQLRQKEPSPFSFTLSSSENSPEFRTALHDSTGNYQETEVHYQGFCFDDQGISTGKQTLIKRMIIIMYFFTSYNITWQQWLFLSRIYLPIYLTYPPIHPFFISVPRQNETHHTLSGRENCFPSGVQGLVS